MSKITFDCQPMGPIAANDERGDVGRAHGRGVFPLVMGEEALSDTLVQALSFSDIECVREAGADEAQDIHAGDLQEPKGQLVKMHPVEPL